MTGNRSARDIYPPFWSYGDIDCLVLEAFPEIASCPGLGGCPGCGALPHHKRRISGDITHELKWTRLCIKFLNVRTVKLMVVIKQLRHRIRLWFHAK